MGCSSPFAPILTEIYKKRCYICVVFAVDHSLPCGTGLLPGPAAAPKADYSLGTVLQLDFSPSLIRGSGQRKLA